MAFGITAALDAADISVSGYPLLRGVSLNLQPGSLTVINGPGSGGKSCLLRAFWGAVPLKRGTVICADRDMTHASARRWAAWRRQVGIFCDDFPLCDDWTVFANVAAALFTAEKLSEKLVKHRVNRELGKWGLLPKRHLLPRILSGSERTRLCLARAFVRRPVVAFLDDPLGGTPHAEWENLGGTIQGEALAGTAICLTAAQEHKAIVGDNVYTIEGERLHHLESKTPLPATR
jgi:ABC-type ATPase involved in cell division